MSLTEASYYFRKIAPFAILGIIGMFILYYSIQLIILLFQLQQPKTPSLASIINPAFGPITKPVLANATGSAGLTYVLDTTDGVTVTATPAATVYFLPEAQARFGFRENIFLMAKNLDINTELTKYELQGTQAVFSDSKNKLSVNILNYNFDYEYIYLSQEDERLSNAYIPNEETINKSAVEILSKIGRYPSELARGKRNIVYLAFNPQTDELTVVDKAANANLVEVDFYREDIDGFPVATPRYFNSQNYLVLLFDDQGTKVVKGKISFFDRSTEQTGIYPIKTGDQAWEEFTSGGGYIVSGSEGLSQINIKKMFMGYFDPDIKQNYLQPVYIFLGENNFVGYVPAVTNEFLTEATPSASPTVSFVEEATDEAPIPSEPGENVTDNPEPIEEPTIEITPPQSPTPTKKSSGARVKTKAPSPSPTP
jgi:hypothetical protein